MGAMYDLVDINVRQSYDGRKGGLWFEFLLVGKYP